MVWRVVYLTPLETRRADRCSRQRGGLTAPDDAVAPVARGTPRLSESLEAIHKDPMTPEERDKLFIELAKAALTGYCTTREAVDNPSVAADLAARAARMMMEELKSMKKPKPDKIL